MTSFPPSLDVCHANPFNVACGEHGALLLYINRLQTNGDKCDSVLYITIYTYSYILPNIQRITQNQVLFLSNTQILFFT